MAISDYPNRLQYVDLPLDVQTGVHGSRISFGMNDQPGASYVDDPMIANAPYGAPLFFARPEAAWNAVRRAMFISWDRGWVTDRQGGQP